MSHIKFDYSKVLDKFVAPHEVEYMQAQVTFAVTLCERLKPSPRSNFTLSVTVIGT